MKQLRRSFLLVVAFLGCLGAANADDVIPTIRLGTMQGPSVGATLLAGSPWCLFTCSGTGGLLIEGEAGLGGAKGALGVGFGSRKKGDLGLVALKAAAFRSWSEGILTPSNALYAGPECDIAAPWGVTLGFYTRLDAPGWRVSAGIVRTF